MKIGRREFIKTFLMGFTGLSLYGYIEPIKIEVTRVKVNLGFGKKILFITDTHLHGVRFLDDKMIEIVSGLISQVDIVLLGGDQYDELTPGLKVMDKFLDVVTMKDAYYVNGNHEHWSKGIFPLENVEKYYMEFGLKSINNRAIWIDNLKIGGLDWIYDDPVKAKNYASKVGEVDILVSHTPDSFSYVKEGYKLMLAGHTHGGQVLNGLIGTNSRFGYISGLYRDGERVMYLSRGAGEMLPIRLFTPREITVIEV